MSDVQMADVAAMMAEWEAAGPVVPEAPAEASPQVIRQAVREPVALPELVDPTPTHVLWRQDGTFEIVSLNGLNPDHPDLTPLPGGFEASAWREEWQADAAARTLVCNLGPLKARLQKRIDEEAEVARHRYITPGAGQAITYIRKETEARARAADPEAPTPLLDAEAAAIGVTVDQLVTEVITAADQWLVIGSAIEALRRGAKEAVNAATDAETACAAAEVAWPGL
jgi:hypothetical protein